MISPDITIKDVSLQLDKTGRYIEGKIEVIMTLKNNSDTSTYYVLKRPRNIEYDKRNLTLSIGLYEKQLPKEVSSSPSEPEQIAIQPGATLHWQYLLPVWMKKIIRPPGLREIVEVSDISGVQKVVCTVAYHTNPFRIDPSDKPEEVLAALSRWGTTVTTSFERTLIDRASQTDI